MKTIRLKSNISPVGGLLGRSPSEIDCLRLRGWGGFVEKLSKCAPASVPASVHGQAMRTLVIHKINLGPNPQRRLSAPVLMMSSVLQRPNALHVSSHTCTNTHRPAGDRRSGSFSPLEKEKRGEKELVDISAGRRRSKIV